MRSPNTTNCTMKYSSDPEQFTITLVNMDGHNVDQDLAVDVDASEEEYTIDKIEDIPIAYVS